MLFKAKHVNASSIHNTGALATDTAEGSGDSDGTHPPVQKLISHLFQCQAAPLYCPALVQGLSDNCVGMEAHGPRCWLPVGEEC